MKLADFDYHLPSEAIAQTPIEPRDSSRLLVLDRSKDTLEHRHFYEIGAYLKAGDVLVLNQTRVIPARLQARKTASGGAVEILLLQQIDDQRWLAIVGGSRIVEGVHLTVTRGDLTLGAVVEEVREESERVICFERLLNDVLQELGETPLPPYITTPLSDPERYQTVYSRIEGSAAAPTAGLHFTPDLLLSLRDHGIQIAYCTLHIGLDTFAPVKVENVQDHKIHRENALLSAENAHLINEARLSGGRIVAVGTTAVRTLESAAIRSLSFGSENNDPSSIQRTLHNFSAEACPWRPVIALDEETDLFITPGFQFRAVDVMITNFHLPKSTLLMLVSAFAGRERILAAYQTAIQEGYRFYSLGDSMLIL